jgi:hypothetical protein
MRIPMTWMKHVWLGQGIYYLISGIWPLVSIRTFELVTGPKFDVWLVHTVGLFLIVIGVTLLSAGKNRRVTFEIFLVGLGSAVALGAIDVVYALKGRISPIYLLDALVEIAFAGLWIIRRR